MSGRADRGDSRLGTFASGTGRCALEAGGEWGVGWGYQKTGYFLEWLERKFGEGTVRRLNGCLREGEYDGEKVFGECCGGRQG